MSFQNHPRYFNRIDRLELGTLPVIRAFRSYLLLLTRYYQYGYRKCWVSDVIYVLERTSLGVANFHGYNPKNQPKLSAPIKKPCTPECVDTLIKTSYSKTLGWQFSMEDPRYDTFDVISKIIDRVVANGF